VEVQVAGAREVVALALEDHHQEMKEKLEQMNVFSAFSMPCTSKAAWVLKAALHPHLQEVRLQVKEGVCSTFSKLCTSKKEKVKKEVTEKVQEADPDHHQEKEQPEQVNVFSAFSMPCTNKAAWAPKAALHPHLLSHHQVNKETKKPHMQEVIILENLSPAFSKPCTDSKQRRTGQKT